MRKGVIDIGSNTINLLIGEFVDGGWKRIGEFKNPARLGKGGIDENILTNEAINRGLNALQEHVTKAKELQCEIIIAYATAAVRDASNKDAFLNLVEKQVGLKIEVIDGKREAELIAFGIKSSGALDENTNLILDIGGGSTEFVLVQKGELKYLQSFRLGVTRLLEKFNPGDPISLKTQNEISQHITTSLKELVAVIHEYKPNRLVGASGSFDSLAQMSSTSDGYPFDEVKNQISLSSYRDVANKILFLNFENRSKIKGLVPHRVETMPMAILLINYVMEVGSFDEIFQSSYALKEGAMEEGMG